MIAGYIFFRFSNLIYIFVDLVSVVQWIECQIPVLMMGVRIPSGTQKNATGNVDVLVNGSIVGSFQLNDARDDPNNDVVYETGTIPVNGTFTMPSSFNGEGVATFEIHTGAVQNNGNYYYSNSSHTVGLVLHNPT